MTLAELIASRGLSPSLVADVVGVGRTAVLQWYDRGIPARHVPALVSLLGREVREHIAAPVLSETAIRSLREHSTEVLRAEVRRRKSTKKRRAPPK